MRDFGGKVEFQIVELNQSEKPHLSFILHKFEQDTLLEAIRCDNIWRPTSSVQNL